MCLSLPLFDPSLLRSVRPQVLSNAYPSKQIVYRLLVRKSAENVAQRFNEPRASRVVSPGNVVRRCRVSDEKVRMIGQLNSVVIVATATTRYE